MVADLRGDRRRKKNKDKEGAKPEHLHAVEAWLTREQELVASPS